MKRSPTMKLRIPLLWVTLLALCTVATAHVTVRPRESTAGESQRYVVRVPTEGNVATVSTELQIPAGLEVEKVESVEGHTAEMKRHGDRVVALVWTGRIEPDESAEFAFIARNPEQAGELVWKAIQRFADGTSTEWIGPRGSPRPASITTLTNKQT